MLHFQVGVVRQIASTRIPTKWGPVFQVLGFERDVPNGSRSVESALAIVLGDLTTCSPLLRIHSQCFTGEALGSLRCDCRDQLEIAMEAIAEEGRGLVIYEYQEGRGIGLTAKLQAYALQDSGFDTIDANRALGFGADQRDFSLPVAILRELGVDRVRLLSNNPDKARVLREGGIDVVAQVPCVAQPTEHSLAYLRTKKERMGHALGLIAHKSPQFVDEHDRQSLVSLPRKRDPIAYASIEAAIDEFRAGRMIVVVDDEDRENEGDLTIAAEKITPEAVNFMAVHGRGLICVAMTGDRLDELELGPMTPENSAFGGTAFTVSIDLKGSGVTTGISAHDRAQTIRATTEPGRKPQDFGRPGHVFPLRARPGGVLERRGQTEAAVDLAVLAGVYPAGVICEIVNDDGTMARAPDLARFCQTHGLIMITVADLVRYRRERGLDKAAEAEHDLLCAHPEAASAAA